MQALAQSDPGSPVAGLLLATLAAVLFAVGAVLQHEAAELSTTDRGLSLRLLMKRKRWMLGQTATMSGTGTQVAALAVAPVAVVQPMLAVALVVGLGLRAVRNRQAPLRLELIGAALTTAGLAVFLLYARPAAGIDHPPPASLSIIVAVVVSVALVAGGHAASGMAPTVRSPAGPRPGSRPGSPPCSSPSASGACGRTGWARALAGVAVWGALVVAVVAIVAGQQAYARGSLAWSLPALILLDPLAAVPAAWLLLGERLEPGHVHIWLPAAIVAAVGVVVLARTGERPSRAVTGAAGAGSGEPPEPTGD